MPDRDCDSCRWYHPQEGYCLEYEIYCRKDEGKECKAWTLAKAKVVRLDANGETPVSE